jgi:hypothetical protein
MHRTPWRASDRPANSNSVYGESNAYGLILGAAMLVRADGICIGQASHAWLSGQLARAWGNARFAPPEPWEEVCLAAEQHDVGWVDWDLAQTLNAETGLPHDFIQADALTRADLWRAAPRKLLTQSRYAALLVSMHCTALYSRREPTPPVADLLAHHEALQAELMEELGEDPGRARRNQRLLWAWDWLSLAMCLDWAPGTVPADGGDLSLTPAGPGRFTVAPWPFVGAALRVRAEGLRLDGPYSEEKELHEALARAPRALLEFELLPG